MDFLGAALKSSKPLRVICGKQLANEAKFPSKLVCHLKHATHSNKHKNPSSEF